MNKISKCTVILALVFVSGTMAIAQTEIRTINELAAIGSSKNALEESYVLMNNIIVDNWIPIGGIDGNDDDGFCGMFNGNGHTVVINSFDMELDNTRVGLFGLIGEKGVVKNLRIAGKVSYTGGQKFLYIGGIAGFNNGLITCCVSSIELTCNYVKAATEKKVKRQFGYELGIFGGGITGINLGIITHCYSTGSVDVSQGIAGGIAAGNGKPVKGSIGIGIGSGGMAVSMSPGAIPLHKTGIAYCYSLASVSSVVDNTGRKTTSFILGGAGGISAVLRPETAVINNCISLNRLIEAKADYQQRASAFPRFGSMALTHANSQFYYLEGIVSRRYDAKGKELKPTKMSPKCAVALSTIQEESWWRISDALTQKEQRKNISFPFGEDETSPWKWNDSLKLPVLYWETDTLEEY